MAEIDEQALALNRPRIEIYAVRYVARYPERYLFRTAKNRAAKHGIEFDLDYSDCLVPERCPILGMRLEVFSQIRGNPCAASVDRIDNSKGYIKGNVQVISLLANQMKSTANAEQLRSFARWVMETYA